MPRSAGQFVMPVGPAGSAHSALATAWACAGDVTVTTAGNAKRCACTCVTMPLRVTTRWLTAPWSAHRVPGCTALTAVGDAADPAAPELPATTLPQAASASGVRRRAAHASPRLPAAPLREFDKPMTLSFPGRSRVARGRSLSRSVYPTATLDGSGPPLVPGNASQLAGGSAGRVSSDACGLHAAQFLLQLPDLVPVPGRDLKLQLGR